MGGLIFTYLLLPLFIVIPISFSSSSYLKFPPDGLSLRWYMNYITSETWVTATWTSLRVAIFTSVLATLLGIPTSFALVRYRFPGKTLLYGLIVSPLVIPIIITAISIYFWYAKLKLIGSLTGLVMSHTLVALPVVVIVVTASLKGFDINLENAALNLGANPLRTFIEITVPIISPAIISGALFAFIISFDELILTMFICGNTVTLPKKMWDSVRYEIDPTLASVSTILILVSVCLLFAIEFFRKRFTNKPH
jgi:ABC-type spermidine/putrescine transport system permease subunit II